MLTRPLTLLLRGVALTVVALSVAACRTTPPPPAEWEVGYWYWRHSPREGGPVPGRVRPDVLYVQVGVLSPSVRGESHWPAALPTARSYVATWRSDEPRAPETSLAPALAEAYRSIEAEAKKAGQRVVGLQLDVDCPTRSLGAYRELLRAVRRQIGPGPRVSITALLDWFQPRTGVKALLDDVDEYVPQFYDARLRDGGTEIAEPIDVARWAPVFNRLGTPYRIGISVFGRIQRVRLRTDGPAESAAFRDVTLLDLWSGDLRLAGQGINRSGERVLRWDVARARPPILGTGDRVEAVLPTPESVRSAYESARAFGGWCRGVVLFRWPGRLETLVMRPDEVAEAVGGEVREVPPRLRVSDGGCLGRACADLLVHLRHRFSDRPVELQVLSSIDVDYVVPTSAAVRLTQTGPRRILVVLPAFAGQSEVPLGRFFSQRPSRYDVIGGER